MPTLNIIRIANAPHEATTGFRSDTGLRGVDMAGAQVTATYSDGYVENLLWEASDPFTS